MNNITRLEIGRSSTRERKRARRMSEDAAKDIQGYEFDVPRCGNCTFLLGAYYSTEFSTGHGNRCNLGKFAVQKTAICDRWQSKKGETLAL